MDEEKMTEPVVTGDPKSEFDAELQALDGAFGELAGRIQDLFRPFDRTPVMSSANQAILRLQESHMWMFNAVNTIPQLNAMAEAAAEQALANGKVVNMTGENVSAG